MRKGSQRQATGESSFSTSIASQASKIAGVLMGPFLSLGATTGVERFSTVLRKTHYIIMIYPREPEDRKPEKDKDPAFNQPEP